MKSKKSTGELLHEIATTKQDFESFANENKDEFDEFDSRDYLNRLLNMKNLQPTDIIRRSGLERSYVYHILNGERKNPSQGKVIALCIAFELTVEQTQRLLRSWKLLVLYPRNQRDSIILYGISRKMSVMEINEHLLNLNFELLE